MRRISLINYLPICVTSLNFLWSWVFTQQVIETAPKISAGGLGDASKNERKQRWLYFQKQIYFNCHKCIDTMVPNYRKNIEEQTESISECRPGNMN